MTKSWSGNLLRGGYRNVVSLAIAAILLLGVATMAVASLGVVVPYAALKYNAGEAAIVNTLNGVNGGQAETFDETNPILSGGVQVRDGTYWFWKTVTGIGGTNPFRGYAHLGGANQSDADSRIASIQIWGWLDTNGNGQADAGDKTTEWVKLAELNPSAGNGNAVGWQITQPPSVIGPNGVIETGDWMGDILQGLTINMKPGESWILLIRVVDTVGNVSTMQGVGGPERWWSGVAGGAGSEIAGDQYLDCNGNTPGSTDQRIKSKQVLWCYVQRGW